MRQPPVTGSEECRVCFSEGRSYSALELFDVSFGFLLQSRELLGNLWEKKMQGQEGQSLGCVVLATNSLTQQMVP